MLSKIRVKCVGRFLHELAYKNPNVCVYKNYACKYPLKLQQQKTVPNNAYNQHIYR